MISRSKDEMEKIRKIINSNDHISIKLDLLSISKISYAIKKAKKFLKNIDIVLHIAGDWVLKILC